MISFGNLFEFEEVPYPQIARRQSPERGGRKACLQRAPCELLDILVNYLTRR